MSGAILSIYFWKKNFSYPKNFWKKKIVLTKREKKSPIGKKIIFFIFYVKHVSIANMIRSLQIFERFSIIRRFKYSFIERFIYLTMYLEGLYWKGMFGAILSEYFESAYSTSFSICPSFSDRTWNMKVSTKIMFFKKRYIFGEKNFSYPKNFWKKKICANQKGKKKSYRKKNFFFFFM